jgi:hypothetical protein
MALKFDTTECSRCGGSGRYSYNQIHGDRCYGCGGTGQVYTKAAVAAKKIWDPIARPEIALTELRVGMKVRWQTMSGWIVGPVISIEDDSLNPGMVTVKIEGGYGHGFSSWDSTIKLAKTKESHRAAWDAVKDHPGVVYFEKEAE